MIEGMLKVKVVQLCLAIWEPMDCPCNSPGQNTEVGSLSLLQEIFPTQESNQGLPQHRQILYHLDYQGSPDWENSHRQNPMEEREARQGRGSRSSGLRFQVKPDPQGGSSEYLSPQTWPTLRQGARILCSTPARYWLSQMWEVVTSGGSHHILQLMGA